jgi:hypothetical protein
MRSYRQDDALYELADVLAKEVGTTRTTLVELGIREIARMLEADRLAGDDRYRSYLASEARRLDEARGPVGLGTT